MRQMPLDIGTIHFIGIGGIGMSGIAEVLNNLGYSVQGSDIAENANVQRLRNAGIPVMIGHAADNLGDAAVIVVSSAVRDDNPEIVAARTTLLPVVRRAEMLGELMRLKWSIAVGGTHGKTTTTSLIAEILEAGALDPTVINGGIINAYGTNARLGDGDWLIAEADESDGTFTRLPATIVVVTNIDPEHMDHYGSFDTLRDAFEQFVTNVPFYGFAAMCIDHPEVQAMIPRVLDRRVVTYGFSPQANVRAVNLRMGPDGARFDARIVDRISGSTRTIHAIHLPMLGEHNVQNALASIVVAGEIGLEDDLIRQSLGKFSGVKRRFTKTGEVDGVTIIDDYAHHPVEIAAVLKAARHAIEPDRRVIAVVQPHRYSRLSALFEDFCTCFNDADAVIVADVYPAGEAPIPGIDRDGLVDGLRRRGHRQVVPLPAAGIPGADRRRSGSAGRHRDLPGRGLRLPMGQPAAGPACRIGGTRRSSGGTVMMATADGKEQLVDRLPKVRGRISENAPLARFTWFRVGGPAEVLFRPADKDDLSHFLARCPPDVPVSVVGVASNLLIRDGGVPGVVVRLGREFADIDVEGHIVATGAAALDISVSRVAAEARLAGLEFLSGIPGTIGGALRMNAGAYGRELKDILVECEALDRRGRRHLLPPWEMDLSYRHCGISEEWIFVAARLRGELGDQSQIVERMKTIAQERGATQPVRARTGGSTFANPPGHKAWELIDQVAGRGLRIGGAQVSEKHCNFLINLGDATSADLEALGEELRRRVRDRFDIDLQWEIRTLGSTGQ